MKLHTMKTIKDKHMYFKYIHSVFVHITTSHLHKLLIETQGVSKLFVMS